MWPPGNSRDVRQARAVHATTHADHLASAALLTLAPAARRVVWPVVWREKTRDRCGSGAVEHRPIGCIGLSVSARVSAAAAHNRQRTGHGDARKKATRHRTNRSEQNKRDTSPHGNGLMKSWNVSNWDRMRYRRCETTTTRTTTTMMMTMMMHFLREEIMEALCSTQPRCGDGES